METPMPSARETLAQPNRLLRPTDRMRQRYCRASDLPKLVALWPHECADTSLKGRARLILKLRRALRQERLRGISGHWTYDLARHAQLLAAYHCELAEHCELAAQCDLAAMANADGRANGPARPNGKGPMHTQTPRKRSAPNSV